MREIAYNFVLFFDMYEGMFTDIGGVYNKRRGKSFLKFLFLFGAEDGTQTRDPQLGRLMLYQLSYFREVSGQGWIRTTEGVSQQIYSLPHLATLVLALTIEKIKERKTGLKPATLSLEG